MPGTTVAMTLPVAFENVKAGLSDVLRRYKNAVTLWHEHPLESDLALITGCLK